MKLSDLANRIRLETVGIPFTLPTEFITRYPELTTAKWRVGGILLRIGGWCLGHSSVAGFTLGKTIFLAPAAQLTAELLIHELAHVRQYGEDKAFPIRYLWESATKGYRNNRYELEAEAFVQEKIWSETPLRPS